MNDTLANNKSQEKVTLWEENALTELTPKSENNGGLDECATIINIKDLNGNEHLIDIIKNKKTYEINHNYKPSKGRLKKSDEYIKTVLSSKYRYLTPLKFLGFTKDPKREKRHTSVFQCQCDCGNIIDVIGYKLTGKNSKNTWQGCGCRDSGYRNSRFKGYGEISLSKWSSIKRRGTEKNLPFDIDIKYIWDLFLKQDRKCAITGEIIKFNKTLRNCDGAASLDRIDSSKGYVKGNVQWVHKCINFMKLDMSEEVFFEWCKKVVLHKKLL